MPERVVLHSDLNNCYASIECMENMSVREIARQEGCHMNAVLKSVNSALAKLRRLLEDCAP